MIVSGNDASIGIAKHICKDEKAFVERMNKKAKEIGMTNTSFVNPNGLPIYNLSDPKAPPKENISLGFTSLFSIASIAIKNVIILLKLAKGLFTSGSLSYNTRPVSWSISIDDFEYLSTLSKAYIGLGVTNAKMIVSISSFCAPFFKILTFLDY